MHLFIYTSLPHPQDEPLGATPGLVSRMFPDVSRIRRLSAEQEQVIRSGRLALLQMRRVADAHRMHLTKPPVPVPSL